MKTANGNGNHNHSHERRAPSVVEEEAFEPLLDSTEGASLLKNPSKDPADGPQWRDNGNPDRQALALPRKNPSSAVEKDRHCNSRSTLSRARGPSLPSDLADIGA